MQYVFVCSNIDFIKLQYMDFDTDDKGLVLFGKSRKFFKFMSRFGLTKFSFINVVANIVFNNAFKHIKKNKEYCFIIYSREYEAFRTAICRYLRNNYDKCIVVVYYGDLVKTHLFKITEIKNEVDMIFTFDENDAKRYGVRWILEPFSSGILYMEQFKEVNNPIKWDVTFVGEAKDRYKKIIKIYETLTAMGLSCDFHITKLNGEKRMYEDKISYKPLDFSTLLRHVVSSRCVLEVMQGEGMSPTTRYAEAALFRRNLLTDCGFFKDEINREQNILYYSDPEEIRNIGSEEIRKIKDFDRDVFLKEFSVKHMIDTIDYELKQVGKMEGK